MRGGIIHNIRDSLDELSASRSFRLARRPQKTTAVKTALCCAVRAALGDTRGVYICANGVEDQYVDWREWLYDVACLKYADDNFSRPLMRVYMAAECEWGHERAVYNDFEKILIARADVRVMVFDGARLHDDDKFREMETFIRRYLHTQAGDTYLLAARSGNGFEYRRISA